MKQPFIPNNLKTIYPNPAQDVFGTPAVIFRDHRWTLPVIFCAYEAGLLSIPVQLVTFDRHRDALTPEAVIDQLAVFRRDEGSVGELVEIVRDSLSPRDDDWIVAGMELGLIADAIQFKSDFENGAEDNPVREYLDAQGSIHRLFSLGRPVCELTYHGALVDDGHRAAASGLWETMGWDPSRPDRITPERDIVCDIDCDFFTVSWDTYTIPFDYEMYAGEFHRPCQSAYYDAYTPVQFLRTLIRNASGVTMATEPDFCDGVDKARAIFSSVNRFLLDTELNENRIMIDYPLAYPNE